ncbi:Srb5 protein [Martiniozyma asiatica (nom. inval.)]|nr:Srb5 protein [Martiniozyma asiatica]
MVQQLSLSTSVSEEVNLALFNSLSALTGVNGIPFARHTSVLAPRFPYLPPAKAGHIEQIQSHRMRLFRVWESSDLSVGEPIDKILNSDSEIFTLQLSDIPSAGNNPVLIQNIHEVTIYQTDDIKGYLDELGYKVETELWIKGHRWYWGEVIIESYKIWVKDSSQLQVENQNENTNSNTIPLKPLSNISLVKTFINIAQKNDIESSKRAIKQLELLKKELSQIVELKIPDRMSMDSRIGTVYSKRTVI